MPRRFLLIATLLAAASALDWERAVTMTVAPAANRRLPLSKPKPVFAPVMTTLVPLRDPAGDACARRVTIMSFLLTCERARECLVSEPHVCEHEVVPPDGAFG